MAKDAIAENKVPASCRLVAFEKAVITRTDPKYPILVVSGTAPATNIEVFLSHLDYGETPDWWGIEVVGHLPGGDCLTENKHFEAAIPVSSFTGYKGIEVIGANDRKKLPL